MTSTQIHEVTCSARVGPILVVPEATPLNRAWPVVAARLTGDLEVGLWNASRTHGLLSHFLSFYLILMFSWGGWGQLLCLLSSLFNWYFSAFGIDIGATFKLEREK